MTNAVILGDLIGYIHGEGYKLISYWSDPDQK